MSSSTHRLVAAAAGSLVALTVVAPLAQAGSGDDAAFPITVHNCGVDITVAAAPERIVTLEQTSTELALALGLADRIVGTAYLTDPILPEFEDAYAAIPVLADLYPSQEIVLQERPDFVFGYGPTSLSADNAGPREGYADLDIPTYLQPIFCDAADGGVERFSYQAFLDYVEEIAALLGAPDAGAEIIAEQQRRIDAALATPLDDADEVSFVWWYANIETPYLGTEASDAGHIAELLGISNAFADGGPGMWAATSWEIVADRNPTVLVLADLTRGNDGDSATSKIEFLKSHPATAEMDAVRNDRFIVVPASARAFSIRAVSSLELIAAGLHELLADR